MNLNYRKAAMEDIEVLTKTRIQVLRAANKLDDSVNMSLVEKESYEYYRNSLKDGSHIAYLVYDNDRIVGTGGVSFYRVMPTYHNSSGIKAYIMNMYTLPDYRRKGIAMKTIDFLVREAKTRGINFITLEATEMGRPLYEKYGFVKMNDEMHLPEPI